MNIRKFLQGRRLKIGIAALMSAVVAGTALLPTQALEKNMSAVMSEEETVVKIPEPMKVIDFSKGLNELAMGSEYYEIIPSEKLYVQKKPEEVDKGELVDANGIVYFGKEEGIYYYKMVVSNQPETNYSMERGMYLQMGKKRVIPPVYKTKSAGLSNELETNILDQAVPYEVSGVAGVMIQDEYTANSEMAIANPLAGEEIVQSIEEHGGLAFSYWIKAPSDGNGGYEPSSVLRWELGEEIGYDIVPQGELQIDNDNSVFWTVDGRIDKNPAYALSSGQAVSPVTLPMEDGTPNVGSGCDEWHYVVVNMQSNKIEFYVDGICVNVQEDYLVCNGWNEEDAQEVSLLDWITDEKAILHFGGAGDFAGEYGMADSSNDFAIDDLKFYGQNLTEEQMTCLYSMEIQDRLRTVDLVGKGLYLGCVTDASVDVEDAVHSGIETIEGHSVYAVKVDANKKVITSTGAQIDNPFAGMDAEGVTLGYWVKQDDAVNTSVISFVDEERDIYHPKGESASAKSILYVENTGLSIFAEGYFESSVCNSVKNLFYAAPDEEGQQALLDKSTEWMYITLSMDNMGVRYYVNGEPAAEVMYVEPTSRFMDGYYISQKNSTAIHTLYGVFGSTGNQGATTMMEFLTNEETKLYLGYYPVKGGQTTNKTSGCTFAGFKYTQGALTDEEVKEFYQNRYEELEIPKPMSSEEPENTGKPIETTQPQGSQNPEVSGHPSATDKTETSANPETSKQPDTTVKPQITTGDVDGDDKVTLTDAQMVLKAALKIESFDETQIEAADVDQNGRITLEDAQRVLKAALKIITL